MSFLKSLLPIFIKNFIKSQIEHENLVFTSQAGEDIMLKNLFYRDYLSKDIKGFYVDIGAYHPQLFSNTHFFYKNGWTGINVDGTSESIDLFNKERIHDINIHSIISNIETDYYFPQQRDSMNGISENAEGCIKVKSITLKSLFEKYLPKNTEITFMSIDTEGHEYNILKSNDWSRYRPKVLLVEIEGKTVLESQQSEIVAFLESINYKYVARSYIVSHVGTSVFVANEAKLP